MVGDGGLLIVGAGPAGACLALALARQGVQVTLIEASGGFARQFRGEALMPSGLEALRGLDLWPLAATVPQRTLRGWSFHVHGRGLFEVDEPMGSAEPCTLIDQEAFLTWVVGQALQQPGFRLLQGCPVVELRWSGERVSGVELADGTVLEADLVIGCDGRGSALRRLAAVPFTESASPIDVLWFRLMGPQAKEIGQWLRGRFVTLIGPTGNLALVEDTQGTIRLGEAIGRSRPLQWPGGGDGRSGAKPARGGMSASESGDGAGWRRRWLEACPAELARRLEALPDQAIEGPLRLRVRVGLARRWHRPGLLVIGDAAHPMSPLRAQGINMALRDALCTARHLLPRLAPGLRHSPDPVSLDQALAGVCQARIGEVVAIQAAQEREARRAELLRRQGWLRQLLRLNAHWVGPLIGRHWTVEQRHLREGLQALCRDSMEAEPSTS